MKNPGKRIARLFYSYRVGRILFCGISCHDEFSFPLSLDSLFTILKIFFNIANS
jgi:hypothetical protein